MMKPTAEEVATTLHTCNGTDHTTTITIHTIESLERRPTPNGRWRITGTRCDGSKIMWCVKHDGDTWRDL